MVDLTGSTSPPPDSLNRKVPRTSSRAFETKIKTKKGTSRQGTAASTRNSSAKSARTFLDAETGPEPDELLVSLTATTTGGRIVAPQTPASTLMDSDDDFNSIASTDGFGVDDDQDSEISVGGGKYFLPSSTKRRDQVLTTVIAESGDEEYDDPDIEFDMGDKDILRTKKKSFEVNFSVYSPSEIQAYQTKQIDEVSMIIGQPSETTAILLRHNRWNKERLIESYMDNERRVLERAGLGYGSAEAPQIKSVPGFVCEICYEDGPKLITFAMRCGHRFCVDCYRQYLGQKLQGEGEAARIKCPGDGCNKIVDSRSLDQLVTADLQDR